MYDIYEYETTDTVDETREQVDHIALRTAVTARGTSHWDPAISAYASDHLFAVLADKEKAAAGVATLLAWGVAEDDVCVYSGPAHARLLEQREQLHLLTRFFRTLQEAFTYDEHTSRQRYARALRQGKSVVLVYCPRDEDVQRAAEVLAQSGARQMVYYGRWNIQLVDAARTVTTGEPYLPLMVQ